MLASGVLRYEVDPAHPKYASDSHGCLYNKSFGIIYQFPLASPLTRFALPPSVAFLAHDGLFANARNLAAIDLRESQITTLQELTFFGCPRLTEVLLPRGLRAIRPFCFLFCAVTAIEIPRSVSWIEAGTFAGNEGLAEIAVDPENLHFAVAGGVLYGANLTTVYCAPPGREWDVLTVADGATEIGEAGLQAVRARGIVLPDSLKVVGEFAMGTFPAEAVTGGRAVRKVSADWISIGGGIEEVGENAFLEAEFGLLHWRGSGQPARELCDELQKAAVGKITVGVDSRVCEVCGVKVEKGSDPAADFSEKENL
jgi:hypothetical protein